MEGCPQCQPPSGGWRALDRQVPLGQPSQCRWPPLWGRAGPVRPPPPSDEPHPPASGTLLLDF